MQVCSQYGGQSISLSHLAPFVDVSRKKIKKQVESEIDELGISMTEEQIVKLTEKRLRDEVSRGVQTIQYQVVTLLTTNGQAPFVTVFMYLNEAKNEQEKKDLALIIEETLKQRIQGVKNEDGVWITPAFPKLIYVLEEDNIKEGSSYFYLTELAAKCTAKRMVPDYISEKVMKQLWKSRSNPNAVLVFNALNSLLKRFLNNKSKVLLFLLVFCLVKIHKYSNKRCLSVSCEKSNNLILNSLHTS
jgi:ribonucleoside-triphosphate reductase